MEPYNASDVYEDSSRETNRNSSRHHVVTLDVEISADDLAETLVALANSHGGTLLLKLDGTVGETASDEVFADAVDRLREAALRTEPVLILPLPELLDSTTLVVTVPPGLSHVFAVDGRFLARDGESNRALSPRELRRLLIERADLSYEEELAADTTLDDLNWRAVEAYATRIGSSDAHS